jgi:hypothetical protein
MFNHPHISNQIVQDRHREMLASAEQQRLARQVRAQSRPGSRPTAQPAQDGQPLLRALRTAARLRLAARSAASWPEPVGGQAGPARTQAGPARGQAGPAAGWPGQDERLAAADTTVELASR